MSAPLHDRVAIVTGGAKGIGRAVCARLAELGAAIGIIDMDAEGAARAAAELPRAVSVAADVADYGDVRAAVGAILDAFGRVDVLVNNAGWDRIQPFLENDPEVWDRLIGVNLRGVFNVTHVAVPHLIEAGGGRVVNIASDAGRVGSSGEAVYSACKGGVIAFTKTLAREVARKGVTVNCVCPGPTDTALLDEIRGAESGQKIIDAIVRATPVGRLAQPEDIAAAVAFFATAPGHVTGQVLSVSGGLTMAG
ncbi:MAG: glucose 1-dehydrogenase [Actinomycetota bacterium]